MTWTGSLSTVQVCEGMGYTEGKTCSSQYYVSVAKFPANANQALQNLDHFMYVSYH